MASNDVWVMQTVTAFRTRDAAAMALPGIAEQDGCIGARVTGGYGVVGDRRVGKRPAVQAFFYPAPPEGTPLPDGCRCVMLSSSIAASFGVMT